MSYLFIVIIGAAAGWITGQFLKTDDSAFMLDLMAGAVGAVAAVLLSRFVGPSAAGGFAISALVSIAGAAGGLYALRRFMHQEPLPAPRGRRR